MIKTRLFLSGKMQTGGDELVAVWLKEPEAMIWIDLTNNDKQEEAEFLESNFKLHPLAIQDAQRDRHPPKIEAFDEYTFILLRGLSAESNDIDFKTIQLALFVGKRFLITRHSGMSLSVARLEELLTEDNQVQFESMSEMALNVCRLLANRYIGILLDLEPRLEELEELMLDNADDNMLAELTRYKSDLKRLNRIATYHEQLFKELKEKSFPCFAEEERIHEVIDVWEKHERSKSLSQLYYETASDLIEGYISIASHRLNQIMKVLTIVMAVFVPLSFMAGIYGMNFENMPELHSQSGYYILLSIMGGIAALLLYIFRKIKWL
jgi:magnesium transporter